MSARCDDVRSALDAWLDDATGTEESLRIEDHVRTCEECRRERDALQRTRSLLASAARAPAPEAWVRAALAGARRSGASSPSGRDAPLKLMSMPWMVSSLAAAAVVAVVFVSLRLVGSGGGLGWEPEGGPGGVAEPPAAAGRAPAAMKSVPPAAPPSPSRTPAPVKDGETMRGARGSQVLSTGIGRIRKPDEGAAGDDTEKGSRLQGIGAGAAPLAEALETTGAARESEASPGPAAALNLEANLDAKKKIETGLPVLRVTLAQIHFPEPSAPAAPQPTAGIKSATAAPRTLKVRVLLDAASRILMAESVDGPGDPEAASFLARLPGATLDLGEARPSAAPKGAAASAAVRVVVIEIVFEAPPGR